VFRTPVGVDAIMADYCVKRDGLWRFVRRAPKEYAGLDPRRIVQHSTGIRIADDPRSIRARKVADILNGALETHWRNLVEGESTQAVRDYEAARQAARRPPTILLHQISCRILPFLFWQADFLLLSQFCHK